MKIVFIILALLYVFNPYDVVPDFLVGWGWLDDLLIMGFLWRYIYLQKKKSEKFNAFYRHSRKKFQSSSGKQHSSEAHSGSGSSSRKNGVLDPYQILGLDSSANQDEIKKAYRLLANKYHPDKVAHLGDEFKQLAEERFKEIQKAYQEISKPG